MVFSTRLVTTAALAVTIVIVAGCARRGEGGSQGSALPKPGGAGYYMKKVVAKESPDLLMANDATFCRVPASQFRAVTTGMSIRCNWQ